jgi:hypothetical protein
VLRVPRASGKAVWTWPPVGATDAGPMQIQLREGVSLRCAEAVLWGATTTRRAQRIGQEERVSPSLWLKRAQERICLATRQRSS